MSTWSPITLEQLWDEVISGESTMDPTLERLWNAIRIEFVKWKQHPWGDQGDGFWVVGLIGNQVLWYNDIEDGFNWSRYTQPGVIDEYWCNQDELNHAIYALRDFFENDGPMGKYGPPQPVPTDDA